MKFSIKQLFVPVFLLFSAIAFPQDTQNSGFNGNLPVKEESGFVKQNATDNSNAIRLEEKHKHSLENGRDEIARQLESQIKDLIPAENYFSAVPLDQGSYKVSKPSDPQSGDWLSANSVISPGVPNVSTTQPRQLDIKQGEDGILYAVYNSVGVGLVHGYFYFYRSTDNGRTWQGIASIGTGNYIGSISMSVDSRSNSNPDSTRLVIYYTASFTSDLAIAQLLIYSYRVDGLSSYHAVVASPPAGRSFTNVCAVSDGAYWENATYIGAICSESDNVTGDTYQTRFFRSINWGVTWASASFSTGYNDLYPSADYKEGSPDSVYIAVERKFDATHSEIRVLSVPWSVSSVFTTNFLTSSAGTRYEKPCITIKQEGFADSVLITSTKNGLPVYHFTPNGGASWITDASLASANGSNKSYTYCSSSRTGTSPFSACWVSSDGDSVNVRRGVLGFMGSTVYKVNSFNSLVSTMPVCATPSSAGINNTIIAYASSPTGIYSTQEGTKSLNVKIIPQGFYNPETKCLNMKDTIRVYLRKSFPPYAIADSGKGVIDSTGYGSIFNFNTLNDGSYYLEVKHRNFLETWSSVPLSLIITGNSDYNFSQLITNAYGSNMTQVDSAPLRFAAYSGDVNQSGIIDLSDITIIYNDAINFATGYNASDVTGNNFTDLSDLTIAYNNALSFVSVMHP